jgi:hypothetical protein
MAMDVNDRLAWLERQIAGGWWLEAPVLERPAYHGTMGRTSAFEFILRHDGGCQVIAVPDCPELRSFLRERDIDVVIV